MTFYDYFWNVFVGVDQAINTIFGGTPDETISSRWGRSMNKDHPIAEVGGIALDTVWPHHTSGAIQHDKERAETVEAIEDDFENGRRK